MNHYQISFRSRQSYEVKIKDRLKLTESNYFPYKNSKSPPKRTKEYKKGIINYGNNI